MNNQKLSTPTSEEIIQMNIQIEELLKKAKKRDGDLDDSIQDQLELVQIQRDLFLAKINSVSLRVDGMSEELTEGVSKAWDTLKTSFERAKSYMH